MLTIPRVTTIRLQEDGLGFFLLSFPFIFLFYFLIWTQLRGNNITIMIATKYDKSMISATDFVI